MEKEKELRKFRDRKNKLKVTLVHDTETKTFVVYLNHFKATYNKLSTANYHFESAVFENFMNRLPLAEWVMDGIRR